MARGVGRLFEGGDYFKYFHQRGAIILGRRLIKARLFFEEIRYVLYNRIQTFYHCLSIYKRGFVVLFKGALSAR